MEVQYLCKLIAVRAVEFKGKEGQLVEYAECSFLNEDSDGNRSVIQMNTTQDLTDHFDQEGTLVVEVDPSGKRKPRLVSFTVDVE